MILKHEKYKNVTVTVKGKEIVFAEGRADVPDTLLCKELLRNPSIKEVKEEKKEEIIEEEK